MGRSSVASVCDRDGAVDGKVEGLAVDGAGGGGEVAVGNWLSLSLTRR